MVSWWRSDTPGEFLFIWFGCCFKPKGVKWVFIPVVFFTQKFIFFPEIVYLVWLVCVSCVLFIFGRFFIHERFFALLQLELSRSLQLGISAPSMHLLTSWPLFTLSGPRSSRTSRRPDGRNEKRKKGVHWIAEFFLSRWIGWNRPVFSGHFSFEQWKKGPPGGCLGCLGDDILPSCIGIADKPVYRDPHQPTSVMKCHKGFLITAHLLVCEALFVQLGWNKIPRSPLILFKKQINPKQPTAPKSNHTTLFRANHVRFKW